MESIVNICIVGLTICASVVCGNNYVALRDIIMSDGYDFETHKVLTDDGYYLRVFRIRSNSEESKRPPVLMVHGLGGSAADFAVKFDETPLAYLLSDEGFVVWLLSSRGTVYSQKHATLKSTDSEFWNYSWHEIGIYDVPNTIDYILKLTGFEKLLHIGLSQGPTSFYVMLSERPEYNDKILAHVSYSPITFCCHSTNALLLTLALPEFFGLFSELMANIGYFYCLPSLSISADTLNALCNCDGSVCLVCQHVAYIFLDLQQFENFKYETFRKLLQHFPAGASVKSLIHFAQGMYKCQFRHYRYSKFSNPKEYDLSNIKVPLFIFTAERDNLQNSRVLMRLISRLPNGFNETVVINNYGHADFMMAHDTKAKVYDQTLVFSMLEILKRLV